MNGEWNKVSKQHPCPICGHARWCLVSPDGEAVLCNRVESDKPAKNSGWIHGTPKKATVTAIVRNDAPAFDANLWWSVGRYALSHIPWSLNIWSRDLGLPVSALSFMGATTCCGMLCFPMHDGAGNVCGIRTRTRDGQKRAITGSKAGVFLSTVQVCSNDVLICEGPTDAAAALDLGFEPLGRPSCLGQEAHVVDTLRRWGKDRATICADADGPGITGAERLASAMRAARISVRMVAPHGHKDLRDWYRSGVTRAQVDAAWSQAVYT